MTPYSLFSSSKCCSMDVRLAHLCTCFITLFYLGCLPLSEHRSLDFSFNDCSCLGFLRHAGCPGSVGSYTTSGSQTPWVLSSHAYTDVRRIPCMFFGPRDRKKSYVDRKNTYVYPKFCEAHMR